MKLHTQLPEQLWGEKSNLHIQSIIRRHFRRMMLMSALITVTITACLPTPEIIQQKITPMPSQNAAMLATPLPTREVFEPGQLVDYTAQDGDSMVALAARFNTSVDEILSANTFIPKTTTTLPPGMPMKIPIYYLPLWGSPYQILPDELFVNGPRQVNFDPIAYAEAQKGWLKDYRVYAYDGWRTGPELVQYISMSYSVSPQLLLAILEYQTKALSEPVMPLEVNRNILGFFVEYHENLYLQLLLLADDLNAGYYGWREGSLQSHDLADGELERFDPWQNAATVALQRYFAQKLSAEDYHNAVSANGFARVYESLFGSAWQDAQGLIPGSIQQPLMQLPFVPGKSWSYTGGPHPVWGENQPWAAIDFAPPAEKGGCTESFEWVTAVADGVLTRTEPGLAILDLDGDGDERTGWAILYLHLASMDAAPQGKSLKAGDVIGHPSCERGRATGTHIHIGRKYNGEWIPAYGLLPFDLEGWISQSDGAPYKGTMVRNSQHITANTSGDAYSQIESGQ